MNLNYDKIKSKVEHGGNHWTSYSDLFLVLSVVFLLLYVVANLRSGTMSIAQMSQLQTARQEADELKRQIKAYEVLKQDYLEKGATGDEVQMYQELMGKLTLLETEAKDERAALFKQAKEAEEKEQSLNRYQQMVKNIINANLVAQQRLKKRDVAIEERDQVIVQRDTEIDGLNRSVQGKQAEIAKNNRTISQIEEKLAQQIKEVQYAYRSKKNAKEKMDKDIAALKADSAQRVESLRRENSQYMSQLQSTQANLAQKNREAEQLMVKLSEKENKYKAAISDLENAHRVALDREKSAFEQGLKKGTVSLEAKLKQEQEYKAAVERQNQAYAAQMQKLQGELANNRQEIKGIESKYQGSIQTLQQANDALQKGLQASNAKLNQQRMLAQRIKDNFRKAGIDADVDLKTGDVTINFANEYFDTGRADLKSGMRSILQKFMPEYANSLFQDPNIAKRIGSVEIVGFASPTYQGKYVDPESLNPEDRTAVNFNMDLSYQRAKSIFEHVFDTQRMQFKHQKELLPHVKVTGRSYLATERLPGRGTASGGEYCSKFDCKKSQRVIIKFNLKDE